MSLSEKSVARATDTGGRDGDPDIDRARRAAADVLDPEIPVLTLADLGVIRGVERRAGRIVVSLTDT